MLGNTASPARAAPADSLFCRRAGVFVLVGTLCLCWPMLLQRGPLVFFDTGGYLWHGWQVVDAAARVLGVPDGVPDPAGGAYAASSSGTPSAAASGTAGLPAVEVSDARSAATKVANTRSLPYSLFVYISSRPVGLIGTAMLQTALVLLLTWALLRDVLVPFGRRALIGCAAVALLTPLPFMASFATPAASCWRWCRCWWSAGSTPPCHGPRSAMPRSRPFACR